MRNRVKISGRSSTITNSFVQSLIPEVTPSESEVLHALDLLEIDPKNPTCSYCGDPTTEWDHLRPLVRDKMPTGFISEIGNLVPSCGKCNQSKGNKPWRDWIQSAARLSPASRGITDLATRIRRLEKFENWRSPDPLDLESIVGNDLWAEYWSARDSLLEEMRESQKIAERIREAVLKYVAA
jgi:hypothetical protein